MSEKKDWSKNNYRKLWFFSFYLDDIHLSSKLLTVTEFVLISITSDSSSGISQFESSSSSSVQWHHKCTQPLNVVLHDLLYAKCFSIPPSSLRQDRSCFHFLLKGSAKLRSDEPSQTVRASPSIFPPQVTLRLSIFKSRKWSIRTRRIWRSTALFWGMFTFLTGARLELVTISLVRFLIRSSCSLWSWSFSCSSWERTSFSVAVVWVTEETWKWTHRTCDHVTLSIMSRDWRKQAGITILTSWSRRLRSTISFRYRLSKAPSSDTSVTWGSFFIFFAVLAN